MIRSPVIRSLVRSIVLGGAAMLTPLPTRAAPPSRPLAGPVSRAELLDEIADKMHRVQEFLRRERLGGVLLTRVANVSWLTAGIADSHIVITSEIGAASLLITRDGGKYLVASNSEVPRLMAEDLAGLGFQAREHRWYEDAAAEHRLAQLSQLAGNAPIATDVPLGKLRLVADEIAALRSPLTATETAKYRWLGRETAAAVVSVARAIEPGMSEQQIEAMTADALMRRGIRPTVLLIGTDERIARYRHATPTAATLERYAMINVCARRWGLVAAVTRLVHFGPVPPRLRERLQAAGAVNAALWAATGPGRTAGELLEVAKAAYARAGHPREWQQHHQGGAIGYGERDWVARPGDETRIELPQAFAWNPTVTGAKVEDTVLALPDGRIEILTRTPDWPTFTATAGGQKFPTPGILVR